MFPIFEVRRVYDETICKGQRITWASLYGKSVLGLADSPGQCKDCRTYTPPDGGSGLRWSTERFSNPEGSSYRDGGGRTFLGGKCDCDPSGSLVYGEGEARCPVAGGVDTRLKKLITSSCKEKPGPGNEYTRKTCYVEVNGVVAVQCSARWLSSKCPMTAARSRTGSSDNVIT
jgi:hypothetical protein